MGLQRLDEIYHYFIRLLKDEKEYIIFKDCIENYISKKNNVGAIGEYKNMYELFTLLVLYFNKNGSSENNSYENTFNHLFSTMNSFVRLTFNSEWKKYILIKKTINNKIYKDE